MKINLSLYNPYNVSFSGRDNKFGKFETPCSKYPEKSSDSGWNYPKYISQNYKIDFSENPQEHERDIFLGRKITHYRNLINSIDKRLETEKNEKKKQTLLDKKEQYLEEKSKYANELVTRHLAFALKLGHQLRFLPLPYDDLVSSLNIGLMQAAEKFDPDAHDNIHFVSYARYWMKQQAFRDAAYNYQVRVPINTKSLFLKVMHFIDDFKEKNGTEPAVSVISKKIRVSERTVKHLLKDVNFTTFSLDGKLNENDDRSSLVETVVSDEGSTKQFDEKMQEEDFRLMRQNIDKLLDKRERYIIIRRYRLDENQKIGEKPRTLEELSQDLGITRERVRQLENSALMKLRKEYQKDMVEQPKAVPSHKTSSYVQQYIEPQNIPASRKFFISALTSDLCLGEDEKTKVILLEKMNSYSADEFDKILQNVTSEKRAEVLRLLYGRKYNPSGYPMSLIKASKMLDYISKPAINYRKEGALSDLKRFLLEGDKMNYSFLKDYIIEIIPESQSKGTYTEKVRNASVHEINKVINNMLTPNEAKVLITRFKLNEDNKYGMQVLSFGEISEKLGFDRLAISNYSFAASRKLIEYFTSSPQDMSNLAKFANIVTSKIQDANIKETAKETIKNMSKKSLDTFFLRVLTPEEANVLKIRYNLNEHNNPKQRLITRNTIVQNIQGKSISDIKKIQDRAFNKIRQYFEKGFSSNLAIFALKVCEGITDEEVRKSVYAKIMSYEKNNGILSLLSDLLEEKYKNLLVDRYSLDNDLTIKQKQKSRAKLDGMENIPYSTLKRREHIALNKVRDYFIHGANSNVDLFAKEVAKHANSENSQLNIYNKIRKRPPEIIKEELKKILNSTTYNIVVKYFDLDNFIFIVKSCLPLRDVSAELSLPKQYTYYSKADAMKKIFNYYNQDEISNITLFAEAVAKKLKNKNTAKSVIQHIESMHLEELKAEMKKVLGERHCDILIRRYNLQEFLSEAKKLPSLNDLGNQVKLSAGTLCLSIHKSLEDLADYYNEICN